MRATLRAPDGVTHLDIPELKRRLSLPASGDVLPGDPVRIREGLFRPASVLVPIVARDRELTVLLTRRTERLRHHSGQVAFPGGREEPHDPSPEATALRETREEIGLEPRHIEVIGRLDEYRTGTGFRITPVVGIVRPPFSLMPDDGEVDEIFEVPLTFLFDPANHEQKSRSIGDRTVSFYEIGYSGHVIWGATAGMLVRFYRRLVAAGGPASRE